VGTAAVDAEEHGVDAGVVQQRAVGPERFAAAAGWGAGGDAVGLGEGGGQRGVGVGGERRAVGGATS